MLYVVGFGCGSAEGMTIAAQEAIRSSDVVVGYKTYTDLISRIFPEKQVMSTGMRQERQRVEMAVEMAKNSVISLVCSGDSQLYAMAGLALEIAGEPPATEIEIVPGVTAAFSAGALLGSPMTCDTAIISLSDLLTPAEKIVKRLRCAASGDFVIALYNPSSRQRSDYLRKACDILLEYRSPETICGIARNIGRNGQECRVLSLGELRDFQADMFTTVIIGNSDTRLIAGKMVTPRGYRNV